MKNITAPVAIGLDIGTTTISMVVTNALTGALCDVRNIPGGTALPDERTPAHRCQSTASILDKSLELLESARAAFPQIAAIGLTGQMHGIVYTDAEGKPCSELYTWQDGCGDLPLSDGLTTVQRLSAHCKTPLATGYGAVTHAYLAATGRIPANAVKFSTIMDCLGMQLTGRKLPLSHATNAASFGFWDITANAFDRDAILDAGLDYAYFPDTAADAAVLGTWHDIPVYAAIGDNQASFRGSVSEPESCVLVNIGTGSQISVLRPLADAPKYTCDLRPYDESHVLANYSALCGGYAYALLESFVRQLLTAAGLPDKPCYDLLGALAAQVLDDPDPWQAETTFSGTRADPAKTASFTGVTRDNFTPAHLARSVLEGIVRELHDGLADVLADSGPFTVIGSGNAVRKNPVLREIITRQFGADLEIPDHQEEAAVGAAIYALQAVHR
ncbi:MAG: hypothetical protein E7463_11085 [Ruminococcaceae bacterium]|nr:hypothetical protein [Oscillospiraceae bacterium]